MVDKQIVERHFSRAAAAYDTYACVQKKMAYALLEQAQPLVAAQAVLEIGCGTGFLTQLLLEACPQAAILASDIAPGMLAAAQQRLAGSPRLQFAIKDGEALSEQTAYDVVISNAVFQWFTHPQAAFQRIFASLRPGGQLVFATFGPRTFWELHAACRAAAERNQLAGSWQTGPEFLSSAQLAVCAGRAGFQSRFAMQEYQEYFPAVRDFLHSVKKVGANNSAGSGKTLVSRRAMTDMMELYAASFGCEGRIPATYQVIYGICEKPLLAEAASFAASQV